MMRQAMSALPWIVVTVLVVEFAASDHLADPRLRRLFVALGAALLAGTAVGAWRVPEVAALQHVVAASGTLMFLGIHALLRWSFLGVAGREPTFMSPGAVAADRTGPGEVDPDGASGPSWIDYVYSFLLGAGMLLSAAGAMSVIIDGA